MTSLNPCILLVQTDEIFTQKATLDLKQAGYTPVFLPDLPSSLKEWEDLDSLLIVIDRRRSGSQGIEFCRQIRKKRTPVIILLLVERETLEERIVCLESGADDYILKSYPSEVFLQRVNFYLRPTSVTQEQLRFGDLVLDLSSRRLLLNDKSIELTMKEFELLKYLMSHAREVLSREQILENVWGYDYRGESNVIEVYIRYLRLKIENEGQRRLIHTVRGVGYVLRES